MSLRSIGLLPLLLACFTLSALAESPESPPPPKPISLEDRAALQESYITLQMIISRHKDVSLNLTAQLEALKEKAQDQQEELSAAHARALKTYEDKVAEMRKKYGADENVSLTLKQQWSTVKDE